MYVPRMAPGGRLAARSLRRLAATESKLGSGTGLANRSRRAVVDMDGVPFLAARKRVLRRRHSSSGAFRV